MSPLPFIPEGKEADLFMEVDRRLSNLEGKVGSGLSHNDLKDIEDHKTFIKQDGTVPITGNLDFSKSARIKNSANRILNVDIETGIVRINAATNQLVVDESRIDHGSIQGLGDDDHTQYLNDTRHDAKNVNTHADISSAGANIEDAVTKKHDPGTNHKLLKQAVDPGDGSTTVSGTADLTYDATERDMINALKVDVTAIQDKLNTLMANQRTAALIA